MPNKTLTSLALLGATLLLAGCASSPSSDPSAQDLSTSTQTTTNTSATATIDAAQLTIMTSSIQNGDSISPTVIFSFDVGISTSEPVSSLTVDNISFNDLEASGSCGAPDMSSASSADDGFNADSPWLHFNIECTTTGAYTVQSVMDSEGVFNSIEYMRYAGLQPKDIDRTVSFDLIANYPDGSQKNKRLSGSFDAEQVIAGVMNPQASLTGLGERL